MIRLTIFVFSLQTFIPAFCQDLVLSGHLSGFEDGTRIILNPYLDNMDVDMDHETVLFLKEGEFRFSEHLDKPTRFSLRIRPQNPENLTEYEHVFFWAENVPMTLTGMKGEIFQSLIKGSSIQDHYFQYVMRVAKYQGRIKQISDSAMVHMNSVKDKKPDVTSNDRSEINRQLQAAFEAMSKEKLEFIFSNPGYYCAPAELVWSIIFNPREIDSRKAREFYASLNPAIQSNIYGKQIARFLESEKVLALGIGDYPYNFMLKNSSGNEVRFSSINAKVILLDFWASGCGPCRVEHKNYVTLYHEFKQGGFEIVSVNQDQSKTRFAKAMTEDAMSWTNLWDKTKEISNQLYGISFLPANYLIVDGRIEAINLRGEALRKKLEGILKKD